MYKIIISAFFLLIPMFLIADTPSESLLAEIKVLIEQNAIKIEQNAIKLDQFDKRFDFMQNLIYIILVSAIGITIYLDRKKEKYSRASEDKIKEIIFALKKLAQDDPKISKSLKVAGVI